MTSTSSRSTIPCPPAPAAGIPANFQAPSRTSARAVRIAAGARLPPAASVPMGRETGRRRPARTRPARPEVSRRRPGSPRRGRPRAQRPAESCPVMHRPWLAPRRQRHRYRRIQAGLADRFHQQHRPSLGDHRTAAALDADTRVRPDTLLHLGIASFLAANRALSKSYRWQEHFPRSRSALGQAISRKREANARQCVL